MGRWETCPYTRNSTTHTCNFIKQSYPIKDEVSCFTENTIYSIKCIKGSGTFYMKSCKNTKTCPLDGSSEHQDTASFPSTGSSKLLSCLKEAQYIGRTSQQFRERMSQHRRSVSPFLGFCETCTLVGFTSLCQDITCNICSFWPWSKSKEKTHMDRR